MTRRIVHGQVEDACPRCGLVIVPCGDDLATFAAKVSAAYPTAEVRGLSSLFICEGCGASWLEAETPPAT